MSDAPLAVYTDVDDLDPTAGVALLQRNGFEVTVLETRDPDVIVSAAEHASVLLVGYAHITADMIAAMPQLRLIALLSRGYDNIDLDAATSAGIQVSTVGHIATEEVSTHAWAMTMALVRRLPFFAECGLARDWIDRPQFPPLRLSTVTVGVIGLGRIGQAYARIATTQAGTVFGYDPSVPADRFPPGVQPTDLATLLTTSDVVSLHMPLTAATNRLVDGAFLAAMKPGSYLINVSRGALVDSAALAASLDCGHLAGAGIDTLDLEPPTADHPLLGHPSVLLSPHVAYLSDVSARGYIEAQAANAVAWLKSGIPNDPINTNPVLS